MISISTASLPFRGGVIEEPVAGTNLSHANTRPIEARQPGLCRYSVNKAVARNLQKLVASVAIECVAFLLGVGLEAMAVTLLHTSTGTIDNAAHEGCVVDAWIQQLARKNTTHLARQQRHTSPCSFAFAAARETRSPHMAACEPQSLNVAEAATSNPVPFSFGNNNSSSAPVSRCRSNDSQNRYAG